MNLSDISDVLLYMVPALLVGIIAYYFFSESFKNENSRLHYLLKRENQKQALPIRLQAYERMSLFLERIKPAKLLLRLTPNTNDKNAYEDFVVATIEQEFEHNLTQQIYISEECWTIITTAKNATIQLIRKSSMSDTVNTPDKLREVVLKDMIDRTSPSDAALAYIKKEVMELF